MGSSRIAPCEAAHSLRSFRDRVGGRETVIVIRRPRSVSGFMMASDQLPYSVAALLELAWQHGFRTQGDQSFIRISSNRPWSEIANEPLVSEAVTNLTKPWSLIMPLTVTKHERIILSLLTTLVLLGLVGMLWL
jgi:hypothetical protein